MQLHKEIEKKYSKFKGLSFFEMKAIRVKLKAYNTFLILLESSPTLKRSFSNIS